MINPYQPPLETPATGESTESPSANFQLTARQMRFAESKYLLHRCGGRLTLLSLVMIALALLICFDWPWLPLPPTNGNAFLISLVIRELVVMLLATVGYLGLIRGVRQAIRQQLASHGLVAGAAVSVVAAEGRLNWTTPKGAFDCPIKQVRFLKTRKGLIVVVDRNLFVFLPKRADFAGASYRVFVRSLQKAQSSITAS